MPKRPRRLTLADLMLLVALAALLAEAASKSPPRPMSRAEATQVAVAAVSGRGPWSYAPVRSRPASWRTGEVERDDRGFVVHLVPRGPRPVGHEAVVLIDTRTRLPYQGRYHWPDPANRNGRATMVMWLPAR